MVRPMRAYARSRRRRPGSTSSGDGSPAGPGLAGRSGPWVPLLVGSPGLEGGRGVGGAGSPDLADLPIAVAAAPLGERPGPVGHGAEQGGEQLAHRLGRLLDVAAVAPGVVPGGARGGRVQ